MGTDGKSNSFILGAIPAIYHKTFEHTSTKGKIFIREGPVDSFLNSPVLATTSIPGYLCPFCLEECVYISYSEVSFSPLCSKLKPTNQISPYSSFFSPRKQSYTNMSIYKNQYYKYKSII